MSYGVWIDSMVTVSVVIVAFYFLWILLAGGSRYRVHAFVLCIYFLIYTFLPELKYNTSVSRGVIFLQGVRVSMILDGLTGVILAYLLFFDKLAWKHAVLFAFMLVCHIMVISCFKQTLLGKTEVAYLFVALYDELMILVGLLQMAISYNGIISAYKCTLRTVPRFILRTCTFMYNTYKSLAIFTKG